MKKYLLPGTIGVSVAWILGVLVYVTTFVGWQNLSYFLPSELAVVVLALALPLVVGLGFILVMQIVDKVDALAKSIGGQTSVITEIAHQVSTAVDDARKDTHLVAGDFQAILSRAVSGVLESQGGFRPPVVQGESRIDSEALNPNDFTHLGTLITLFNVALNDLSVITTRLLVKLLEDAGASKEDVRAFITGLLDAYSAGDKNVFFRALRQQLDAHPEHLTLFKKLTAAVPDVRRDVSKILREAEEIMSMVQRCDRQNLIRIVFEGGELWSLQQYLIRHFDLEGDVRETESESQN